MFTLRQWRRAKEISVASMAKTLGVHPNTYIKWEDNPGMITMKNAHLIAEIIGVRVEAIDFLCSETPQKCGEVQDV